eukprot:g20699.t1
MQKHNLCDKLPLLTTIYQIAFEDRAPWSIVKLPSGMPHSAFHEDDGFFEKKSGARDTCSERACRVVAWSESFASERAELKPSQPVREPRRTEPFREDNAKRQKLGHIGDTNGMRDFETEPAAEPSPGRAEPPRSAADWLGPDLEAASAPKASTEAEEAEAWQVFQQKQHQHQQAQQAQHELHSCQTELHGLLQRIADAMFEQSQRTQHAQQVLSQSFYSQPQSFYPLNEGQPDNKLPQCYDLSRELPPPLTVPTINPWKEPGRLVEALSYCGAVFISTDEWSCPYPSFPLWKGLWKEALLQPGAFKRRPLVSSGQLRFSQGEDLLRTMSGSEKIHTPDVRYNFGLGLDTLRQPISDWGDLHWLREEVGTSFNVLSAMLKSELFALGPLQEEPPGSLGALVARGFEYFNGSRMRHCVYPAHGSCTEHTDYGLVTFQQSTAPGLEDRVGEGPGEERPKEPGGVWRTRDSDV